LMMQGGISKCVTPGARVQLRNIGTPLNTHPMAEICCLYACTAVIPNIKAFMLVESLL
jgi:hypothetical protein